MPIFYYRARVSLAELFSYVIPNFADGQFSTVSGLSRNRKALGELIVLEPFGRCARATLCIFGPPKLSNRVPPTCWRIARLRCVDHACEPRNPQNVSNSAVPELVNEMARSLGEGPVLASIKQCGADANKEKSPFDVPWHLARKPYRLQTSMYLRGFCNAPGNIFKNTKTKTIAHDTAKIEEFMHTLHFFCSNDNLW